MLPECIEAAELRTKLIAGGAVGSVMSGSGTAVFGIFDDAEKAEETARRLQENKFDMNDLLDQFQQIKKMGSLKSVMSMIPGMERQLRDVDIDDRMMLRTEAIIKSMTKKERQKPEILNASRRKRIAAGAGVKVEDVNKLMKQYEQMKKMFKLFQIGREKSANQKPKPF